MINVRLEQGQTGLLLLHCQCGERIGVMRDDDRALARAIREVLDCVGTHTEPTNRFR